MSNNKNHVPNMVYPNFKNKHLKQALFNPHDLFINTPLARKNYKKLPEKYIFIYYPKVLNYFKRRYGARKIRLYRMTTVYKYRNIGVVQMTGIGSPHAATIMEELIALGGKEFLNVGSAGGLREFGTFLCERAIRDEGTSYHYVPHGKYAYPDKGLTARLGDSLRKSKIPFEKTTSWTIDTPYRETKAEIRKYRKQGVATVEMESSALFIVAGVRKVKIASAFAVTDVLGHDKWNPQFDARHVNKRLYRLLDAAIRCLVK